MSFLYWSRKQSSGHRGYWGFQTDKLQIHKSRAAPFHGFYDLAGQMFVFVASPCVLLYSLRSHVTKRERTPDTRIVHK